MKMDGTIVVQTDVDCLCCGGLLIASVCAELHPAGSAAPGVATLAVRVPSLLCAGCGHVVTDPDVGLA